MHSSQRDEYISRSGGHLTKPGFSLSCLDRRSKHRQRLIAMVNFDAPTVEVVTTFTQRSVLQHLHLHLSTQMADQLKVGCRNV